MPHHIQRLFVYFFYDKTTLFQAQRQNPDQICDQETRLLGFGIGLKQVSSIKKVKEVRAHS